MLRDECDVRKRLLAVQAAQDALDGVKAALLVELGSSKDHEIDGASTVKAWVRQELRMKAGQATALAQNSLVVRDLPLVAEAALAGRISAAHVQVFAYGIRHVGLEPIRRHERMFLDVALDKEDVAVDAVPDGWHVTGFLNTVTGAKLKKVLDSVSAPDGPDDSRSGSQRRVQGLDDLLDQVLAGGLPDDKGVTPHLSVFVDADMVVAAAERVRQETDEPHLIPDPMPDATSNATPVGRFRIRF